MPQRTLTARVDSLEEKVKRYDAFLDKFDGTLETRFRAQAEMLDERFAEVNQRFAEIGQRFARVDQSFTEVRRDIAALQKDMTSVREGVIILLKRLT